MEPEGQIKLGLLSPSRKRRRVSSKEASGCNVWSLASRDSRV